MISMEVRVAIMPWHDFCENSDDEEENSNDDDDGKKVKCFEQVPRTECRNVPRNVCNPVFPMFNTNQNEHNDDDNNDIYNNDNNV